MLSLPLAKLSVALDTDPDSHSFTWHHETHSLTFVIDTYGTRGSSQLLKVVQGTQVRVHSAPPFIVLSRFFTAEKLMSLSSNLSSLSA